MLECPFDLIILMNTYSRKKNNISAITCYKNKLKKREGTNYGRN
jgi:hypothetical protein